MTTTESEESTGLRPGVWHLDPLHSSLIFVARYLRFGRVQGTFGRGAGTVLVANSPLDSKVEITLDATSVNTGVQARDDHLRSADFLDVARYPELRFVSSGIVPKPRRRHAFALHGELTIRGTTRPISIDGEWVGEAPDHSNPDEIYGHFFTATTHISLAEFGVGDGGATSWGERVVGDRIDIVLEVRLQDQDPRPFMQRLGHI